MHRGHGGLSLGQDCGKLWLLISVFSEKYLKRARRGLKLRTHESERGRSRREQGHARGSGEQVGATPELFLQNEQNTRRKTRKRRGDFCVTASGDAFPPRCVLSPARALYFQGQSPQLEGEDRAPQGRLCLPHCLIPGPRVAPGREST